MLVHRFGVLRKPTQSNITLRKTTALVVSLCSLHNFCIHERLHRKESAGISEDICAQDYAHMLARCCVPLMYPRQADADSINARVPRQLMDG